MSRIIGVYYINMRSLFSLFSCILHHLHQNIVLVENVHQFAWALDLMCHVEPLQTQSVHRLMDDVILKVNLLWKCCFSIYILYKWIKQWELYLQLVFSSSSGRNPLVLTGDGLGSLVLWWRGRGCRCEQVSPNTEPWVHLKQVQPQQLINIARCFPSAALRQQANKSGPAGQRRWTGAGGKDEGEWVTPERRRERFRKKKKHKLKL